MKLNRAASIAVPIAAGLAAAAGLSLTANASAARPAASTPKIALYDCANQPVVRPKQFDISCDGSFAVTKLSWSSWSTTEATGTGVVWINNCTPNCAQGKWTRQNAVIVLWRPEAVTNHKGDSGYSKMTMLFPGSGRTDTITPPGEFN